MLDYMQLAATAVVLVIMPIVFHLFMAMNTSLQDILLRQPNLGILFISLRQNHGCGHLFLFLR